MAPEAAEVMPTDVAVILARMEVKLDHALTGYADHETRIRVLERKVWAAAGAAAALGTVGGSVAAKIFGG